MGIGEIALVLVPVVAYMALGFALRNTHLFVARLRSDRGAGEPAGTDASGTGAYPDAFWAGAEKLAYFVLLPALLFSNIAAVDLGTIPLGRYALALVLPTLVVTGLLFGLRRVITPDAASFTSVLQGAIRFNTYLGVSLAVGLVPGTGGALAAIVGAVLVPLVNVLSTLGFELLLVDKHSWLGLARTVILNPLVLACLLGAGVSVSPWGLGGPVLTVFEGLAAAALPIGLMCVGAGLRPFSLRLHAVGLLVGSLVKMLLLPALTVVSFLLLGVTGDAAVVGLVFQSISTASSAYVMSRQLGGNAPLMAAIIAAQTVVGLLVLPVVLLLGTGVLGIG
ncbi:AEC family transporter [Brevibacterium litoralis]|uniref:AEC family transporter n=1 Tax=Brevibacterium litoralis TaxID=3138935 RepID=UPI0032EE0DB1